MGFVEWRSDSGLNVVEQCGDVAAISRLLRQHDDDLRLVPGWPFRVYSYRGPNHPAEFVLAWQSEAGEPLPLSSRLVDEVIRHDRNSRGVVVDADVRNQQQKQAEAKQWERDQEAITEEWLMKHGRAVLPRSQGLRRARDKRRAKGEKI